VVMAALLHDLGKVTHTTVMPGPDGQPQIVSPNHAGAGVTPARVFLRAAGCPETLTGRITPLIKEHRSCLGRPTASAVRRLARRLAPAATMAELAVVIGADRAGRGDPQAVNPAQEWLAKAATLRVTREPVKGLLTGYHLIAAGLAPGPLFTPLLAAAVAAQDAGEFTDETGAVAWLDAWRTSPARLGTARSDRPEAASQPVPPPCASPDHGGHHAC
jgi:tRNA nucleotidyltransferase (CCA-adding enzyme)